MISSVAAVEISSGRPLVSLTITLPKEEPMRISIGFIFLVFGAFASPSVAEPPQVSRVGVIVPLSGSLAEYGLAIQNGIKLATLDSGAEAAIDWVWEDSKSDTKAAVSAFERLASSQGIEMVILWGTTPTEAVAPIAQARGIPLLAMSVSSTVASNRSLVLRTVGDAGWLVQPLVNHLRELNIKRIALLKAQWVYTEELARALSDELGPSVQIETYPFERTDSDFRSAVTKIRNDKFDIVGVFLGAGQIRTFFRQAAELKLATKFFGSDFFGSEKEIDESGPVINGAVFPHLSVCPSFIARYKKQFGDDTHVAYAVNAYDMAELLIQKRDHAQPKEMLFEALEHAGNNSGVCDNFSYIDQPDVGKYFRYPVALYRVQDGKYHRTGG